MIEVGVGNIDFGFMFGNSYVSFDNDSFSVGLSLNGYYFGVFVCI